MFDPHDEHDPIHNGWSVPAASRTGSSSPPASVNNPMTVTVQPGRSARGCAHRRSRESQPPAAGGAVGRRRLRYESERWREVSNCAQLGSGSAGEPLSSVSFPSTREGPKCRGRDESSAGSRIVRAGGPPRNPRSALLPDIGRTNVAQRDADTGRLTAKWATSKSAAVPPEGGAVPRLRRWLSAEEFVHPAGRCSRVGPEVR